MDLPILGLTLSSVVKTLKHIKEDGDYEGRDQIVFTATDGRIFKMHHRRDCCEWVDIESVVGDLDDLVGNPILMAEQVTGDTRDTYQDDVGQWTFYKFATIKGYVDIRWYGESNGYYSTKVDFEEVKTEEEK